MKAIGKVWRKMESLLVASFAAVASVMAIAAPAKAAALFAVDGATVTQATTDIAAIIVVIMGVIAVRFLFRVGKSYLARLFLVGATGLAAASMAHAEGELFTVPSATVTQATTDIAAIIVVIMGVIAVRFLFRVGKSYLSR